MSTRKLTFWGLLVAAVLALSQFLAAWREWRAVPTPAHAAAVAVLGLGLLVVMAWLGFLLYEVDRAAGRVRHQVGVYEWVIAMRGRGAGR
jgi:divalent metal cation (Fe/Co/Zn/Cd) transporter